MESRLLSFDALQAGSGDVRTLMVHYEASGERYRVYPDAVSNMVEEPFNSDLFPLEGPRTSMWWLQVVRRAGATPMSRHHKWVSEGGLAVGDRSVYEHEIISEALELMCCNDQLQVCNLVSAELLIRRLQLIEEAHFASPTLPSYEGAEHWMGTGRRRAGVLVNPQLSRTVADKVKDEYAVAKERRKAKEERRQAPKPKAKFKPGGQGGGDKGAEEP